MRLPWTKGRARRTGSVYHERRKEKTPPYSRTEGTGQEAAPWSGRTGIGPICAPPDRRWSVSGRGTGWRWPTPPASRPCSWTPWWRTPPDMKTWRSSTWLPWAGRSTASRNTTGISDTIAFSWGPPPGPPPPRAGRISPPFTFRRSPPCCGSSCAPTRP